jgi:hypothetical protein
MFKWLKSKYQKPKKDSCEKQVVITPTEIGFLEAKDGCPIKYDLYQNYRDQAHYELGRQLFFVYGEIGKRYTDHSCHHLERLVQNI